MVESTSAYDRMTLQVEKTAADLRQLVSKGDFKCMAEICATNQRAAAAESELAALRATLRMQSGGNWLQYPVPPQHCAAWALEARGAAGTHAFSQPCSPARILGNGAAVCPSEGPGAANSVCVCEMVTAQCPMSAY